MGLRTYDRNGPTPRKIEPLRNFDQALYIVGDEVHDLPNRLDRADARGLPEHGSHHRAAHLHAGLEAVEKLQLNREGGAYVA